MISQFVEVESYAGTTIKNEYTIQNSDTIAIILPGGIYTVWGPSLYYSYNLVLELGYDALLIEYGYQKMNLDFQETDYQSIVNESVQAIQSVLKDKKYSRIVLIGKSAGTSIISEFIDDLNQDYKIIPILITPSVRAVESMAESGFMIAVGTKDPYIKPEHIKVLETNANIKVHLIENAGHDLDVETVEKSIVQLKGMINEIKEYLLTCST